MIAHKLQVAEKFVVAIPTRVSWEVERASKISSTMRSDRKEARLSFTSLVQRERRVMWSGSRTRLQRDLSIFITHTHLILLIISTPDCSRRVLVTKLLGTIILAELAFTSSVRRLLLFITWGHRDSAASTMDSSRAWTEGRVCESLPFRLTQYILHITLTLFRFLSHDRFGIFKYFIVL